MNTDDAMHVHDSAGIGSDLPAGSHSPLGVSTFLPIFAATALVRAAQQARQLPEYSTERVRIIRDAVRKVREEYPRFFRQTDDRGQRQRSGNR